MIFLIGKNIVLFNDYSKKDSSKENNQDMGFSNEYK
jgi:hypothetical protein